MLSASLQIQPILYVNISLPILTSAVPFTNQRVEIRMADAREAPQASKEIPKVTSKGTPTGTPKGTREDDPEKPPKGEPKGTPNDAPEEGTKNTTKDAKQPKNEISSNKTDDIVLPTGWEKWDPDQKLRWLNTQVLPSDPNINLGDCYRRSAKLTRIFRIVMNSVKNLRKAVVKRASATLKKYWNAFALALQNGVGRLSNYIYDNCEALLKNGNFPDGAAPLPPVRLPDLPMIDGDEVPEESPNQKSKTKDGKPEKPLSDVRYSVLIAIGHRTRSLHSLLCF